MMKLLVALALLTPSALLAEAIVFCGPPVEYNRSADENVNPSSATVLHRPAGLALLTNAEGRPTVPVRDWVCDLGDVREMTPAEKTQRDADQLTESITTARVDAQALASLVGASDAVLLRALIELLNKRDNYLVNRIIELQDRVQAMIDATGNSVSNMKTDAAAIPVSPTRTRTRAAAVQDLLDDIAAGVADNHGLVAPD